MQGFWTAHISLTVLQHEYMFSSPGGLMSLLYKLFNCLLPALRALFSLPCRFLVYTYSQYVRAEDGISTHFKRVLKTAKIGY